MTHRWVPEFVSLARFAQMAGVNKSTIYRVAKHSLAAAVEQRSRWRIDCNHSAALTYLSERPGHFLELGISAEGSNLSIAALACDLRSVPTLADVAVRVLDLSTNQECSPGETFKDSVARLEAEGLLVVLGRSYEVIEVRSVEHGCGGVEQADPAMAELLRASPVREAWFPEDDYLFPDFEELQTEHGANLRCGYLYTDEEIKDALQRAEEA